MPVHTRKNFIYKMTPLYIPFYLGDVVMYYSLKVLYEAFHTYPVTSSLVLAGTALAVIRNCKKDRVIE
jgi:hypothetical protein